MSNYYLFEQSGGVQILRTDNPQPHWSRVSDDKLDAVFTAINEGLPVRIVGDVLEVADPMPPVDGCRWDWDTRKWVDARDVATAWVAVRAERDTLLKSTDWTQLPDVPTGTRERWAAYRQALRDITDQPDPFNIVWPVAAG